MRGLTVSRLWLAFVTTAVACSCLPVSVRVIGQYRYAEWAIVDRDMLDSLLFALPVATLLSMVTARIWFAGDLPWLLPHLPRARATAVRDAVGAGAAAAIGLLLGWLPVLVWGFWTATYGYPSILSIVGILAWIVATSVVAISLTVMTRSIWPAIVLSLLWIAIFTIGRVDGLAGSQPMTRLSMLPYDGVYAGVHTPLHQNPALSWLRVLGALLVLSLAVFVLRRVIDDPARRQKLRAGLVHWPALLVVAVIAGSATQNVSIATTTHQPLRCTGAAVRTCVYASHATDLPTAAAIADRLQRNTDGLFSARLVTEGAPDDKMAAPITIYPDSTNNAASDVANDLSNFAFDPHGCYAKNLEKQFTMMMLLKNWLTAQGTGSPPDTSGMGSPQIKQLQAWNRDPAGTNAKLRALWPRVQRCDLSLQDLPQ